MKYLTRSKLTLQHNQAGAMLLLISAVALLAVAMVTLFTVNAVVTDRRVGTNTYESTQAFNAAQAGLDYGIVYLDKNRSTVTDGQILTAKLPNGTAYSVQLQFQGGSKDLILLVSTGTASGSTATRVVKQVIKFYTEGAASTPIPVQTKDRVWMRNNAKVYNLEGAQTVDAGGQVTLNNNAKTLLASGVSSTASSLEADVDQNDASLKNKSNTQWQVDILSQTINSMEAAADMKIYIKDSNSNISSQVSGKSGVVIWVDSKKNRCGSGTYAYVKGNVQIGTPTKPVTLIVDGQLQIKNNVVIYGNVYTNGKVELKNNVKIHGMVFSNDYTYITNNAQVNGGVVSMKKLYMVNNAKIVYTPGNLQGSGGSSGSGSYGRVSGGWKDTSN